MRPIEFLALSILASILNLGNPGIVYELVTWAMLAMWFVSSIVMFSRTSNRTSEE